MRDLSRLLQPGSIAVFGGGWSVAVLKQCRMMGYAGDLWPVHPTKNEIEGMPCYASVDDLPRAPDASFIGVNRAATTGIVRALAERGAGGAVCFASGFKEVADGAVHHQALLDAASNMPVLGPNCYGFINYLDGALLWPDQHGGGRVERGVAIIAQSSNIAINLTMQRRALPIAYMLTVGNQAQTGLSDLADAVLDDPRVTVLGLHIEGFDDIAHLEAVFAKARTKNIPVVAIKVGSSTAAQAITLSHTASMAGADDLSDAFFNRSAVLRVRSLDEFIETLKLLHVVGPLPDNTLGSLSCSGGEASLVGDQAEVSGLDLRPLSIDQAARLRATLPEMVTISNPLDYHTFTWGNGPALADTYRAMLDCGFGLTILVLDFPRSDRCVDNGSETALASAISAAAGGAGRFAVVSSLPENMSEAIAERLLAAGIAPMMGLGNALTAAAHAAWIGAAWRKHPLPALAKQTEPADIYLTVWDEWEAKQALRESGVTLPPGNVVTSEDDAARLADRLGYPVVLKGVGKHLLHKTEMSAVKLNLSGPDDVRHAVRSMAHLDCAYLVEKMVTGGIAELLVGVARDPQFGLYLTVGTGGIMVEIWQDARPLLLPASREDIRAALMSLRSAPLLTGFRGKAAGNIDAVVETAFRIGEYAQRNSDTLEELDINPLIVTPESAIAVDALIRSRRSA